MLNRCSNVVELFAAVILFAPSFVFGGEKIRFDDHPEKSAPPRPGLKEGFSRPFDLKPDPLGGDMTPTISTPPANRTSRDPKVEEWIDQKKNWIFSTPSKLDQDAALKQIFNIREYKFNGTDTKSKSTVDRYFDGEGESKRESSAKNNGEEREANSTAGSEDKRGMESNSTVAVEKENRSSTAPVSELNINSLLSKGASPGTSVSLTPGELLPRTLTSFGPLNSPDFSAFSRRSFANGQGQLSSQEQRLQDFQKMFEPTKAPASALGDPINLQPDGTRQAINPIIGSNPQDAGLGAGLSGGNIAGLPILNGRSSLSDTIGSRISSGSSLSPSFSLPSAAPTIQSRPLTLELPRRKF